MFKIVHKNNEQRIENLSKAARGTSTVDTMRRWAQRMDADEAFARSIGEHTTYDQIGVNHLRLWPGERS